MGKFATGVTVASTRNGTETWGMTANAVTSLVVYQNMLDGVNSHLDAGESHLFLVGKYLDKLRIENGEARFVEREVRLDTRRLDKGSHWPI